MTDTPTLDLGLPGRIPDFTSAPNPKMPNTSTWTWYCCSCSRANKNPQEAENYSTCRSCQHERCRGCSIRWKQQSVSRKYMNGVYDRTVAFAGRKSTRNGDKGVKDSEGSRLDSEGMERVEKGEEQDESERDRRFRLDGSGGSSLESGGSGGSEDRSQNGVEHVGKVVERMNI